MKHVYFPIITTTMAHPTEWAVAQLWGEKALINNFILLNPIKGVSVANADIFLLAFLHKSVKWSLKFKFTSIFTRNTFSHSLISIVQCPILIPTGSLVLTNTYYLLDHYFWMNHIKHQKIGLKIFNVISHCKERRIICKTCNIQKIYLYQESSSIFLINWKVNIAYSIPLEIRIVVLLKSYQTKVTFA